MKRFNRFCTLDMMLALMLVLCVSACAPTSLGESTEPPPADLEATPDVPSMLSNSEAEEMIRNYLRSQKPDLNPDVHLPLIKVPMEEGSETLPIQIFRVTDGPFARETFLISGETVLRLGTAFGGAGVTSLRVSDLDQDGSAELLFTYSFGSGIHQSRIGMYAPAYAENQIYEAETAYLGDVGLVKEDRSNVMVKVVEPDDETVTLRYLDTLGHLAIQQHEDQARLVLQVAEDLPEDVRQNLVQRSVDPTLTP